MMNKEIALPVIKLLPRIKSLMLNKPFLLLDKSAIEGFSVEEFKFITSYYSHILTPILIRELSSHLAKKKKKGKTLDDFKANLSRLSAMVGNGSILLPDAYKMAYNDLLGAEIPMNGQIPVDKCKASRSKDGRKGIIIDEPIEKQILRNWEMGIFTDEDLELAKSIRVADGQVDLVSLRSDIIKNTSIQKFDSLLHLIKWIDEFYLSETDPKQLFLNSLEFIINPEHHEETISRWEKSDSPSFEIFAPYAFYYYRVNVIFILSLRYGYLSASKDAKSQIDIEYIYYLPFCSIFSSKDNEQCEIAKLLLKNNQDFIYGNDLKTDIRTIKNYFETLSEEQLEAFYLEYGIYPPVLANSFTTIMWKKNMRPKPPNAGARINLSQEEERKILKEFQVITEESVLLESNTSVNNSYTQKYDNLSLNEKNFLAFNKLVESLKFTGDWGYVKRTLSSENVREFYTFYADLWRPDSNIWKHYKTDDSKLTSLYLGFIDSISIQKLLGLSLYFDEIIIIDPLINPWAFKEEANPISNPEKFESDLLKLFLILISISPQIDSREIKLIPDPTNFSPKFKYDTYETAFNRFEGYIFNEEELEDNKISKNKSEAHFERYFWRLPPNVQKLQAKKTNPKLTENQLNNCIDSYKAFREADPLAIDRYFDIGSKSEDLYIDRAGVSHELSYILCRLMGAIPLSSLAIRKNEYLSSKASQNLPSVWTGFLKKMNSFKFRFFERIDPEFSIYLKNKGYLAGFRAYLKRVYNHIQSSEPSIVVEKSLIDELDIQLEKLIKEWLEIEKELSTWNRDDSIVVIREGFIYFDICESGYNVPTALPLIKDHVKGNLAASKVSMFIYKSFFDSSECPT